VRHPVLARLALLLFSLALIWGVFSVRVFGTPEESPHKGKRSLAQLLGEVLARRAIDANVGRFILLRERRPGSIEMEQGDQDCGGAGRSFRLAIDEDGFVVPSRVHAKPDLSIVFLGGSTTECAAMEPEQRFPYLVGRRLEKDLGKNVNALNGGRAGNETMHSIAILLGKVLRLSPDAVVMMEDINDLTVLMSEGSYWYEDSFKSHLQTSREVFSRWERPSVRDAHRPRYSSARLPGMRREFEANLETFVGITRARGILPVLMTQENRIEGTAHPFAEPYAALNESTRAVAARLGVPLVDLAREIPHEKRYVCDLVHYSSEGAALAANAIAPVLEKALTERPAR
jgi:lysophospholipase L1-like esterase